MTTLAPALLLWGCAALWLGSEPEDKLRTDACAGGAALPATLREPGGALLFGELHGTEELPAFFGEAVCWTSQALPVQAGLEIARTEQRRIDAFIASPGSTSDVEALTSGPFWSDGQDGRKSRAIVALLDRLRRLSAAGHPIEVFAFDISDSQDIAARDRVMADTIGARLRAHPGAMTMVLVGDDHARIGGAVPESRDRMPMGAHLVEAGLKVVSLQRSTPAGTAWTCSPGPPPDCGLHDVPATPPPPSGRTFGVELLDEPTQSGFGGLYAVPALTASPPALMPGSLSGK